MSYSRADSAFAATIRKAKAGDIPEIVRIGRESFPHSRISEQGVGRRISRGHVFFVAEAGGEIAGFIDVKLGETGALISGLATSRKSQGRGIGTALLERALGFIRRKGRIEIELRVVARNMRALNLYKRHGFVVLSRRVWKKGATIYRMFRSIET